MVEDDLQLVGSPGVVHQPGDKLLHLRPQLEVLLPELRLGPGQALQLVRQLQTDTGQLGVVQLPGRLS